MKGFSIRREIPEYRDILYGVLFALHVTIVVGLALSLGYRALSSESPTKIIIKSNGNEKDVTPDDDSENTKLFGGMFVIMILSIVLSTLWITIMSHFAAQVITYTFVTMLVIGLGISSGLFVYDNVALATSLLVCCVVFLLYFIYIRDRIAFAAANLKIACRALLSISGVYCCAVILLIIQVAYCVVWAVAAYGVATNDSRLTLTSHGHTYDIDDCTTYTYSSTYIHGEEKYTCSSNTCHVCYCEDTFIKESRCFSSTFSAWKYVLMLLSFFWFSAVMSNILHTTTSAAVANWWFFGTSNSISVWRSFRHSWSYHFGSICLGSLFVAAVRTLRTILHIFKAVESPPNNPTFTQKLQAYCLSALRYLLLLLERAVNYFNHYAYCYIAIYDMSFFEAAKSVAHLFSTKGLATLLNDSILDTLLLFCYFTIGSLCVLLAYGYIQLSSMRGSVAPLLLLLFAFFAGFLINYITMKVLTSALATVYVCFVENAEAFKINHPDKYDDLTSAWEQFYPGCRSHNPAEDTYKNEIQQGYVPPSLEITGIRGYAPLSLQEVDIQESDMYHSKGRVNHYVV